MFDEREDEINEFGTFGTLPEEKSRKWIWGLRIFLCLALSPLAYLGWQEFYLIFLERNPAEIEVAGELRGISTKPFTLHFSAKDTQSGLKNIVVRISQAGKLYELFSKQFENRTENFSGSVKINGRDIGLIPGDALLSIVVVDQSLFKNVAKKAMELDVDYSMPQIEPLNFSEDAPLTSTVGSSLLLFFKFVDQNRLFSWVTVGEELFPAFPAKFLDKDFDKFPEVYFALLPIPIEYDTEQSEIILSVGDTVGNSATQKIAANITPLEAPVREIELPNQFLEQKIIPLAASFFDLKGEKDEKLSSREKAKFTDEDYSRYFKAVNEDFRNYTDKALKTFFSRPKPEKYWKGAFSQFIGTRHKLPFGERDNFFINGVDAGSSFRSGIFFTANGEQAPVVAANRGLVVVAKDLGIYGNAVILDHGFGLASIYSQLSDINCTEGDILERGQKLGLMGATGVSTEVGMLFEIRIHGIAVNVEDWVSSESLGRNFSSVIKDVKRRLGIKVSVPLF